MKHRRPKLLFSTVLRGDHSRKEDKLGHGVTILK